MSISIFLCFSLPWMPEGAAASVARHDPGVDLYDGDLSGQVHRPRGVDLKWMHALAHLSRNSNTHEGRFRENLPTRKLFWFCRQVQTRLLGAVHEPRAPDVILSPLLARVRLGVHFFTLAPGILTTFELQTLWWYGIQYTDCLLHNECRCPETFKSDELSWQFCHFVPEMWWRSWPRRPAWGRQRRPCTSGATATTKTPSRKSQLIFSCRCYRGLSVVSKIPDFCW